MKAPYTSGRYGPPVTCGLCGIELRISDQSATYAMRGRLAVVCAPCKARVMPRAQKSRLLGGSSATLSTEGDRWDTPSVAQPAAAGKCHCYNDAAGHSPHLRRCTVCGHLQPLWHGTRCTSCTRLSAAIVIVPPGWRAITVQKKLQELPGKGIAH